MPVMPLHRHQLARLSPEGWNRIRQRHWDANAAECLAHWAAQQLPVVVTRQARDVAISNVIAMGLPTSTQWGRRRLALAVPRTDVLYFDEFPLALRVEPQLARAARPGWRRLCAALQGCGATARIYGSFGWQQLCGLRYVHATSDLDLAIAVTRRDQADEVVARLQEAGDALPRLDGELTFGDGRAVAWREWAAWRSGRTRDVLVKHLHGIFLTREQIDGEELVAEQGMQ